MFVLRRNYVNQICFIFALILFGMGSIGYCENEANDISLAKAFPPETLETVLVSREDWHPFPTINDRSAWESLPKAIQKEIMDKAEEDVQKTIKILPASLYLEFKRNGNRSHYQDVWGDRRSELANLVAAECLENKGRFMDAIVDRIWAICEESSWTWPAHIGAQKAGTNLPDTEDQVVALFSAQTANVLSISEYLLGDKLDKVSKMVRPRVERELERRIFTPFLEKQFGWMGYGNRASKTHPNNWNPWIMSNVLVSSLLMEKDAGRRIDIVYKCLDCLDNFLTYYPSDGSCDEGPSYWGRAGASLLDCLEHLYSASNGKIDFYGDPLIKEIGRFTLRAHISGNYFICVGDCDPKSSISHELVYRYGKRIGDPKLMAFGAHGITKDNLLDAIPGASDLNRFLRAIFHVQDLVKDGNKPMPMLRDVWLGNPDMQLMAARDKEGTAEGFFTAAWGGHNAQSHNHNDVGNFIIFIDGKPVIMDIGRPEYTRQTFSSERYQIWAFQSCYHNLPTLNGKDELAGRSYEATDVVYEANDNSAQLTMDIAKAYPKEDGISSWVRTVRLNRGKDVEVTDHFTAAEATDNLIQNLVTPCPVTVVKPGQLKFAIPGTESPLFLNYNPEQLEPAIETIPLKDHKLASEWGKQIYRIRLKTMNAKKDDTLLMRFVK